jgi:hypothetical protein
MNPEQKFMAVGGGVTIALTYFASEYLVPVLGSIAWLAPGIFFVGAFWISKKIVRKV